MTLEEFLKKFEESLEKIASEDREEIEKILNEYKESKEEAKFVEMQNKMDALLAQHLAEEEEEKNKNVPVRRIAFSDERSNQVKDIKDIMNSSGRFLNDAERELQSIMDDAYITATLLKTSPANLKMWQRFRTSETALRKAMDTATATEGAEWVPTTLSANLIDKYRLLARVPALFNEIQMPRNPYKLPTDLSDMTFYLIPESKTSEPSKTPTTKLTTGDLTLTAVKLRARSIWSEELDEESIIPVLPAVKNNIAKSAALAVEDAIINGDTTATHQDSDVTDSKDHRKSWKGLRKLALSAAKADLSTFDKDTTRSLLTKMKKYGITPSELTWIAGVVDFNKLRGLTELLTVDKYGPAATILTGEVGKHYGSPVVVSEKIREDLNNTGVYDDSTKDKTILIVVNRGSFILGNRGNWKLTVDFDNDVDQYVLNVRFKKDFIPIYDATTEPIVALGYKIS